MDLQEGETRDSAEMETDQINEADEEKKEDNNNNPSPRCVLEIPISGTDSDNGTATITSSTISSPDSSASSDSATYFSSEKSSAVSDPKTEPSQWKSMFDVLKKKSVRRFSVIPLLSTYDLISKKNLKRKLINRVEHPSDAIIDWEALPFTKPSWRNFDVSELEAATDNFSSANLIGEGGHAQVYKGELPDGQVVAVKKIIKAEKEEEERVGDFLSELGIIAHINHHNAAKLLGFSIDGGLHLVLEFLPNGSLTSALHGGDCLEWNKRFKVAVGVAEGLRYLHLDCPRRVIHRDIKASNILLTQDYEAQITDFGLAKWLPENWLQHIVFPIEGTFGYLAPEYFMHGIVDEKTDVFAYGVLLLEIITGRRAVDNSRQNLVMWAKPLLDENNPDALVDPRLQGLYDPVELKRALLTASVCIQHLPSMRPHMEGVVKLLKGAELPSELKQSSKSGRTMILDTCDLQDYTCSTYMDDLNRHMQLVMDV